VIPALLARFLGAVTFLDFDDLESGYWQDRFRLPLLRLLEKTSPRLLHFTCVHTEELAEEVANNATLDQSRVLRLDQGVDVSLFCPRPVDKLPRSQIILYAAHLGVAAKGLYFVLEGFRNLLDKGTHAILLVVGGGPLMPAFQEKARRLGLDGMVVFTGQLDHRCMPKIMSLARGAINYLEPENTANRHRASVKVRECLCMGLPVATNIVGSDLTAFLPLLDVFSAGDVEGFARAVAQALARGRREDAHRELKDNWAWEVVVGTFLRQLRQLKG
jgi:glycosyltransferase involved in cell wall biosynthesis